MTRHAPLLVAAVLAICIPAQAAITYNFLANAEGGNTNLELGNTRVFTSGGVTVTTSAWSLTGSDPFTTFDTARLLQWNSYGFGICSQDENYSASQGNCGNVPHSIDSQGATSTPTYEFLLFVFDVPVDPVSFQIDPYQWNQGETPDRDVSYWTGNTSGLDLDVVTLASLDAAGLSQAGYQDNATSYNQIGITLDNIGYVNTLLIGTRVPFAGTPTPDGTFENFKTEVLTVVPTPEPASFLTMGLALIGLGWVRRRAALRIH